MIIEAYEVGCYLCVEDLSKDAEFQEWFKKKYNDYYNTMKPEDYGNLSYETLVQEFYADKEGSYVMIYDSDSKCPVIYKLDLE